MYEINMFKPKQRTAWMGWSKQSTAGLGQSKQSTARLDQSKQSTGGRVAKNNKLLLFIIQTGKFGIDISREKIKKKNTDMWEWNVEALVYN